MKKLIVFAGLMLVSVTAQAQTIDGFDVTTIESEYVDVEFLPGRAWKRRMNIGERKPLKISRSAVAISNGKKVSLRKPIDYINFMTKHGFELIHENHYTATYSGGGGGSLQTGYFNNHYGGSAQGATIRFVNHNN